MIKASVYIICQNEEQHIARVLESVRGFDEIIVVDSGSNDKTIEIAKSYGVKIYHQDWLGFAAQKEYAKNLCTNEWVLNLDADEELTPRLREEIVQTIDENKVDALNNPISGIYLGSFNHPYSKFNRRVKFFRKSAGHYPPKMVHESVVIEGKIRRAQGFILDHGMVDLATHVNKTNTYSSLRAKEKFTNKKRFSSLKLLLVFPLAFIKSFFIKRSFLNGIRGFIGAVNGSYYAFLKEAKLYEQWRVSEVHKK